MAIQNDKPKKSKKVAKKVDTNNDGKPDTFYIDDNGDGKIDFVLKDSDHNGKPDMIGRDTNDDGNLTVGFEAAGIQDDEQGPFAVYVRYCFDRLCIDSDSGRVHFVSDGSLLINSLYDPDFDSDYSGLVPSNDNRKWALDIIAEALLIGNSSTLATENAIKDY